MWFLKDLGVILGLAALLAFIALMSGCASPPPSAPPSEVDITMQRCQAGSKTACDAYMAILIDRLER